MDSDQSHNHQLEFASYWSQCPSPMSNRICKSIFVLVIPRRIPFTPLENSLVKSILQWLHHSIQQMWYGSGEGPAKSNNFLICFVTIHCDRCFCGCTSWAFFKLVIFFISNSLFIYIPWIGHIVRSESVCSSFLKRLFIRVRIIRLPMSLLTNRSYLTSNLNPP